MPNGEDHDLLQRIDENVKHIKGVLPEMEKRLRDVETDVAVYKQRLTIWGSIAFGLSIVVSFVINKLIGRA